MNKERFWNTLHDVIFTLGSIFALILVMSLTGQLKGALGFYESSRIFTFNYENVDNSYDVPKKGSK